MTLSKRGRALLQGSTPEYLLEQGTRQAEAWDPDSQPDGYIGLCVAENRHVWDLLEPKVRAARDVPSNAFAYDFMRGSEKFRGQLAHFLGTRLAHRTIDPDHIIALGGAGSALEILGYVLANPGDGVLVPTPSYAGFWMDLELRDDLHIVPVHGLAANDFRIGVDELETAATEARHPVRALLLTNPDNPRGAILSPTEVRAIIDWAEARSMHVIMDEVYAFSVFEGASFTSALALRPKLGPSVHVVWAFSKDFAASGLRAGVLVSENPDVLAAVDALSYWACVSGDTQFLLGTLLDDDPWLDRYLKEMPRRLEASYRGLTEALESAEIPYVPAQAGFFALADFRRFLDEPTPKAADALWRQLLNEANVNFTPGSACRIAEPGFMRICHSAASSDAVLEAMRRVTRVLRQ